MTTAPILDFEAALSVVREQAAGCAVPATASSPLLAALGRVLAEAVCADRDQPPFDRSTRDGFAVRSAEAHAAPHLRIAGELRAGEAWSGGEILPGDALRIMTGAAVPAWADAIVMVEHAVEREGRITLATGRTPGAGENIVARASEARAGEPILSQGTRISAAEIALAASCGCVNLPVLVQPAVAIIATGDELVELAATPLAHQIRNSNSYAIAAMVTAAGGRAERLPIARDTREDLRARIREALPCDLLLFSGGMSMGDYDLVEQVLAEFDAEFHFTGVRMQPGKPVVFGRLPARNGLPQRPFFGLPGNPISTQVTFHCFVEPFLRALSGEPFPGPRWAQATLAEPAAAKAGPTRLLPCRMDGISARLIAWQGSGDLAANARANCFAELLPGRAYRAGEVIRVLLR